MSEFTQSSWHYLNKEETDEYIYFISMADPVEKLLGLSWSRKLVL